MSNKVYLLLCLSGFISMAYFQEHTPNSTTTLTPKTSTSGVIEVVVDVHIVIALLLGIPPFTVASHGIMIYILFFSSKRHKYTNIFYKLVLTISLVVIYWGAYFWYMGWCQLLGYCPLGETGNIVIASVAQYLFYVCMNMNLLIAFNRFCAVVLYSMNDKVFSNMMGLMYVVIILVVSAMENVHGFKYLMKYYPELGTFAYLYKPSAEFLRLFVWFEMGITYAVHVAIYVLYGWSFYSYKQQSKHATMSSNRKKDRRLLIQALISGSPCFFMMTFHHIIRFPLMELISGEICVGIDPVIYVWFNKEIRQDFFEIFGFKKYASRYRQDRIGVGTSAQSTPKATSGVDPTSLRNVAQLSEGP